MRRVRLIAAIVLLGTASGCATMGEAVFECVFDGVWDSIFGSSTDRVDDDEAHMLRRKGIEPGSKKHRALVAEERFWQHMHKD